jgi:hypothetical protein
MMKRESIIQGVPICVALLIFAVLTSGCVRLGPAVRTYSGDKLQKSEIAIIKGWWYSIILLWDSIEISKIDGKPVNTTKLEVLPGPHELVIINNGGSLVALVSAPEKWTRVDCNFEAGHEYKIKYWFKGILIEGVKIIDVATGAIIYRQPWSRFP